MTQAVGKDALHTPLQAVLGERTSALFHKELGLETLSDLLYYFPRRYQRRGELSSFSALPLEQDVTVLADVVSARSRRMRQRKGMLLEVRIVDATGSDSLVLTFFNGYAAERDLTPGVRALFAGKVSEYRGAKQLNQPEYEVLTQDHSIDPAQWANTLIPVYPAKAKVPSWKIHRAVAVALEYLESIDIPEALPQSMLQSQKLMSMSQAWHSLHAPESFAEVKAAERRFRWQEALFLQVALLLKKQHNEQIPATPRIGGTDSALLALFDQRLPFALTAGQQAVGQQIAKDLARGFPMNRLLQGDVGSGKTIVALRAMLQAVDSGGQAVLLAPTEVLASQHFDTITGLMGSLAEYGMLGGDDLGTQVVLLKGSQSAKERKTALTQIASGQAGIVIGTHALLSSGVEFHDLALVVIDEQHRFGVEQRDVLRQRARQAPHVLVMTATPIPRTVAMTVFGDLDVSVLTEKPGNRQNLTTHVVALADHPVWFERIWHRVREEVQQGHQVFVVCPRIGEMESGGSVSVHEESSSGSKRVRQTAEDEITITERGHQLAADGAEEGDPEDIASVLDVTESLRRLDALQGISVGMLHGKLPPAEKDRAMQDFVAGRTQVLVATTVIEVGVNVPNATMMVIMDADRFGISQLHQLRGRVGRGEHPGLCLVVTRGEAGTVARERLDMLASTVDGFELAAADLSLRGEGDILGSAQSGGVSQLRVLNVVNDQQIIEEARREAQELLHDDPQLLHHGRLRESLADMFSEDQVEFLERG